MLINVHNIAANIKSRLRTPCLVTIEFILNELSDAGSTGELLYLSLAMNCTKENRKSIHYEWITFDLKNNFIIKEHVASVSERVQKLKKMYVLSSLLHLWNDVLITLTSRNTFDHCVVIIYTHLDDMSEDLFYTSKDDREGIPLSTTITSVGLTFRTCDKTNES